MLQHVTLDSWHVWLFMYKLHAEACVACPFASLLTASVSFHGRCNRMQDPDTELVYNSCFLTDCAVLQVDSAAGSLDSPVGCNSLQRLCVAKSVAALSKKHSSERHESRLGP